MKNISVSSQPSRARWPESVLDWMWRIFLIWTAVGFIVMPLDIGQTKLESWISQPALRAVALSILHGADAFWIVLAAINVYFYTVAAEGLAVARRWAIVILAGSAAVECVGALTGFPFGPYRYTDRFGWRIGGVLPFTIPLAWFIILLCGRYLTQRAFPAAARWQLALGVGIVATFTDLNLEFVAWKIRAYWIWYPGPLPPPSNWPPPQNFLSWFVLAVLLTYPLSPNLDLRARRPSAQRPILILALINALFLLAHAIRWARWTI